MPLVRKNIVIGARPFVFWLTRIYRVPDHAGRPPGWGQVCEKRRRPLGTRAPMRRTPTGACGQPLDKLLTIL